MLRFLIFIFLITVGYCQPMFGGPPFPFCDGPPNPFSPRFDRCGGLPRNGPDYDQMPSGFPQRGFNPCGNPSGINYGDGPQSDYDMMRFRKNSRSCKASRKDDDGRNNDDK
ncbi:hypothetical protein FGIG_01766 [Fasciola gigantica]|uniref:Uncharacterized protein n=1 Tax=Fasciola gigantica TaxID=46835 RepID=A0A504YR09_FASGI|nr:hypothetical protein FGIG_01766 [Fasciola gigantica]